MIYKEKPYTSFATMNNEIISVGNSIKFTTLDGEVVEGMLLKASKKTIVIQREDALNTETWDLLTIEEGSLKTI